MAFTTMRLGIAFPIPPQDYDVNYMGNLIQQLTQNDGNVQKLTQDYVLYGVANTADVRNQRLVLRSPNGTFFQILVDDSGNLSTLNLGTSI